MKQQENLGSIPLKASDPKPEYTGQRDLKKIAVRPDSIRLSGDGVFYTIQGEGPSLGHPAIFVRLHHCNLACSWCDAYYTWDKTSAEFWTESYPVSFNDLAILIEANWPTSTGERRVVWTGGEPLMQKKQIDEVMQVLWKAMDNFWHPEIETNGTIMPTSLQLDNYQFNVSPKLPGNSGNSFNKSVKPKVLEALNQANSSFKFVCRHIGDVYDVLTLYSSFIDREKIIIMPEGVTEEEISRAAKALINPCKKEGLRMTPRFQAIFAHGAERGV